MLKNKISILLRLVVAGILFQTLFFKFTGAEESIFIFSTLGVEPWGRWLSGLFELVTCGLVLYPQTKYFGAFAAQGIMLGAILSHLFVLGLVIKEDGGLLFGLACAVFISATLILILDHKQVKEKMKVLIYR